MYIYAYIIIIVSIVYSFVIICFNNILLELIQKPSNLLKYLIMVVIFTYLISRNPVSWIKIYACFVLFLKLFEELYWRFKVNISKMSRERIVALPWSMHDSFKQNENMHTIFITQDMKSFNAMKLNNDWGITTKEEIERLFTKSYETLKVLDEKKEKELVGASVASYEISRIQWALGQAYLSGCITKTDYEEKSNILFGLARSKYTSLIEYLTDFYVYDNKFSGSKRGIKKIVNDKVNKRAKYYAKTHKNPFN